MASVLGQSYPPPSILGGQWQGRNILGGQGDPMSGYYPTVYAVPGQLNATDRAMGGIASVLTAPVRLPFQVGQGIGQMLDQANQAMPWGGNDPSAIGINVREGSIDPSVMVPWATDAAGYAGTGGAIVPKPVGVAGIFGGRLAKTADQAALAKAEQMAAQGVDRTDIWNETGWFQGVDGKWRFEIPDNEAAVTADVWPGSENGSVSMAPLSDNIAHSEAFSAYPDLGRVNSIVESGGGSGSYGPVDGVETLYASGVAPSPLTSTALHEMQHAVQSREGFARGGNPQSKGLMEAAREIAKKAEATYTALNDEMFAFQDKWLRERGISQNDPNVTRYYQQANKEWRQAFPDKAKRQDQAFRDMEMKGGRVAYPRLAGETEARNVSERMSMTPEERRSTPPWLTQDVPDEDQIIRMSLDGPAANIRSMDNDYRGMHKAPGRDENAPLSDLTKIFPDDVYGPNAAQYYGHAGKGDPLDEGTVRILRRFRGKPDAEVTIYRAVPKDAPDEIIDGDWVTINPDYARQHGEGTLRGDYKVISKTVRADDIYTDGNSIHEFGYAPVPPNYVTGGRF